MNLWLVSQRNLRCSIHSTRSCALLCQLTLLLPPSLDGNPRAGSVRAQETGTPAGPDVMDPMGGNVCFG